MSQVTIYKDADINIQVIDGDPPADQTALIVQLQETISMLIIERDSLATAQTALQSKVTAANSAIDAAQALLS